MSGGSDNNLEQYRTKRNRNYVKLQIADTSSVQSISKQFVDLPKKKWRASFCCLELKLEGGKLDQEKHEFRGEGTPKEYQSND